jgi:hypothetical protein
MGWSVMPDSIPSGITLGKRERLRSDSALLQKGIKLKEDVVASRVLRVPPGAPCGREGARSGAGTALPEAPGRG